MLKRYVFPTLLIACMVSVTALASDSKDFRYTHTERVRAADAPAPLQVSALESGLPQTWCGTKSTVDQTVNATSDHSPKFKFFYVRASDMADRFELVANMMQKSISTLHAFMLQASGGKRTVSLDLGTTCGPLYADIGALTLPGTLASYLDKDGQINVNKTIGDLQSFSESIDGPPRHYIFVLDQFEAPSYISGIGVMALDDSPGITNYNNRPGAIAYVATPEGSINQSVNSQVPRALLHEMSHTIGAVQPSAPNATSAGHCKDGLDIMCYSDGSPESAGYSSGVCSPPEMAGMYFAFDCNNNDYFSSNPAPDSYLANKWNVYNSKYLVKCESSDPYCTVVPSSDPTPKNPAARTATNNLYLYKNGKRGKKLGTVSATGAKEPGTPFVRNSVKMSKLRMPKGTWKLMLCFREKGVSAVCESKRVKTSPSGYISTPRIYVTTSQSSAAAWGTVSIKAVSGKNKKKRTEVRTDRKLVKYSLAF